MFKLHPMREHRSAAAVAFLLVLALQSLDVRADLLFRSAEQVGGEQRWSALKNYGNPADIAFARVRGVAPPTQEVRVILSGTITREDADNAAVMAGLLKSGRQKLADNSVWFASTGGDIDSAMDLGRLLRGLRAFTVIGRNDQCMSACVFAFMGGERRLVEGRVGIHRPFFPFTHDHGDRQVRFRHLQRVLKDYFEELDFPSSLYEAVMVVPPESLKILTPAELKQFYLHGVSPSSEDLADAASARRLGLTMFDYLQRKAKAPACIFPTPGQDQCDARVQEAAARGGAADDLRNLLSGEAALDNRAAPRGNSDNEGASASRARPNGARGPS